MLNSKRIVSQLSLSSVPSFLKRVKVAPKLFLDIMYSVFTLKDWETSILEDLNY